MDRDDQTIGHIVSRRAALRLLASGGLVAAGAARSARALATSLATCVVRPAQTEGPYFVDELLDRTDIRIDPSDGSEKPGAELNLAFNVSRLNGVDCEPLPGVVVDLWHCDHLGVYSDVADPGFNTVGKKFLRGYQVADEEGVSRFITIVPGWYSGRTVHMHFKVRSEPTASPGFEFTSQLYFDDSEIDAVHSFAPYTAKGQRTLRNAGDGIYGQGGSQLLVPLTPTDAGYAGVFDIALQNGVPVVPSTWSRTKLIR